MRNIDKIRKMNSEELTEFIMESYINDKCEACIYKPSECKGNCRQGMKKWFDSINYEETQLTEKERAILSYCEENCTYLEREGIFIRAYGYEIDAEDDYGNEEVCKLLIRDCDSFSWAPDGEIIKIEELLKIKQIENIKEEKNIKTNETLYNLIETCRNKLGKIRMIKNGDKYRPIKNTRRNDAYKVLWELLTLFKMFGLNTTYEVMQELQCGEVHKN